MIAPQVKERGHVRLEPPNDSRKATVKILRNPLLRILSMIRNICLQLYIVQKKSLSAVFLPWQKNINPPTVFINSGRLVSLLSGWLGTYLEALCTPPLQTLAKKLLKSSPTAQDILSILSFIGAEKITFPTKRFRRTDGRTFQPSYQN